MTTKFKRVNPVLGTHLFRAYGLNMID